MSSMPTTFDFDSFETLDLSQLDAITGGQGWSWGSFGRSVLKGAVVGGTGGAVAGAFTGPGVLASAGIGAVSGAVAGAVENVGTQAGVW